MGLHILVLAGGGGTRLWPLSRAATPKHLLPLGPGGTTLLRASVERVLDLGDTVSVVTAASQAEGCAHALRGLVGPDGIIAEPDARGTGPALGLATALLRRRDPDAVVASLHADAEVGDDAAYRAAVAASAGWALATNGLATVGLRPTWPSTGMGYVEVGPALVAAGWRSPPNLPRAVADAAAALPAYRAVRMVEKPGAADAASYHEAGTHLWNLGLFAWPAVTFLDELERAAPAVASAVGRTAAARVAGDEPAATEAYSSLQPVAIEPLVLESTSRLSVVEAAFPWSDLGSWGDLHTARVTAGEADADGNVLAGDALAIGARGCTIEARGGRLVAVAGAEGLVVVDTPDALLVVPQADAQRVKDVVERLRQAGRTDLL